MKKLLTFLMFFLLASTHLWAAEKTVVLSSFSAISGDMDSNISYAAEKGSAGTAPAVNSNQIRVYQNGGLFSVKANNGVTITNVILGSAMGTTVTYSIDGGTESSSKSIAQNKTIELSGLSCQKSVKFTCKGTTSGTRLYVNYLSVTYTSGGGDTPEPTKYTVTIANNITNGTVTATPTSAAEGTEVTLTATPATGYEFGSWNVTNASTSAAITVTDNKFTMPAANVNVSATFNVKSSPVPEGATRLFYESFDTNDGTGGNDNQWSGSIASSTFKYDNNDWSTQNASGASKCIKLGAGSKAGTASTPTLSFQKGVEYTVYFKAAAWNASSEKTTIKVSGVESNLSFSEQDVTLKKGEWSEYRYTFTPTSNVSSRIRFVGTASNNRYFLDEIYVYYTEKTATTLTFGEAYDNKTITKYIGENEFASTATLSPAVDGAIIKYESSDEDVAAYIDGQIMLGDKVGTATITATYEGNSEYKGSTASYTIDLKELPAPTFSIASGTEVASGTTVSISAGAESPEGTTLTYKIGDGQEQNYSSPIEITEACIITAYANYNGVKSEAEAIYDVSTATPHTVTINECTNGNVAVDNANHIEGETVTLTVTPAEHYHLATLTWNGNNATKVSETVYTFTMPAEDVTVNATFEQDAQYTVTWSVNGVEMVDSKKYYANETTTPPVIDNVGGYTFKGWSTSTIETPATSATYEETPVVTSGDVTYYAVYSKDDTSESSLTKLGSDHTFATGQNIVVVAPIKTIDENKVETTTYYGMYQETVSSSYVNYFVLDHAPSVSDIKDDAKRYWTLTASANDTWNLGDATNGYLYNASSNNLTVETDNKTALTIAWDSDNSQFTIKNGNRWIACRADLSGDNQYKYRGGGTSSTPQQNSVAYYDFYEFKAEGTVTNYTTALNDEKIKVTDLDLAAFEEEAASNKAVLIGGDLEVVAVSDNYVWVRDNSDSYAMVENNGYKIGNPKDATYTQNNWLKLVFGSEDETIKSVAEGKVINNVKGVYSGNPYYSHEIKVESCEVSGSETTTTRNIYTIANFNNGINLETGVLNEVFFMTPKAEEVCTITYAYWNVETESFEMPKYGEDYNICIEGNNTTINDLNPNGYEGSITVNWACSPGVTKPETQNNNLYEFTAIVSRTAPAQAAPAHGASKAPATGGYTIYPVGFSFAEGVVTGVEDLNVSRVNGSKAVKMIENGRVVIIKDGKKFNIMGQPVL